MIAKAVDGTRLFIVEDEGVVYAHDRQEIFALNTTATYLWCQIEEQRDKDTVLRDYAATFGIAEETAAAQVNGVLETFHEIGLIHLPDRKALTVPARSKPVFDRTPPYEIPPLRARPIVAQKSYQLLETSFLVRFSDLEQVKWVDPILKNFAVAEAAESAVVVDLYHDNDEIRLYRSGEGVGKCDGLDKLAPLVLGCLWLPAIDNFGYFLNLHTGVVGHGDGCVLLPAAAGSGKSTTTAALVKGGLHYLSDEVALIGEDCTIRTLPLAMCFKSTGWDIAGRYFDEIESLRAHLRSDGKIVKYYALPEQYRADASRPYPVKAIIFPKYTPGTATRIEALSKTQALDRMFRECVSIPSDLTEAQVSRLIEWIKGVDCHTLEFSDLDAAVATVHGVLDG
ncbi:MAG: PqqD family peptide modification chaperone [Alphaproteobacteria bacterium]